MTAGQLHLPNSPFAQQRKLPQSHIPHETQLLITHPMQNLPPLPNPPVNPPPILQHQQLVNLQLSMIPSSIPTSTATYLPVPNTPQQNIVHSTQDRLVPCPTAPKRPLNYILDLNLWHFPQNNPPNVNQVTNDAAVWNNFWPTLPSNTANPAISHPIRQLVAP